MSSPAFLGDVSDLKYGLLPDDIHEKLQSVMFSDRVEASKELLPITNLASMRYVELGNFLLFIGPYLHDENFEVCSNVEAAIESLIQKFGSQSLFYIEQFKSIIFPALCDIRRAVRIITVNMMVTLSLETQSFILLQTALDEFDNQPNLCKAELLTFVNSLIDRITPPESYFKPISSMLDSAFYVQNGQVRSSAVLLLQCFVKLSPSIRQMLTEQCESYLFDVHSKPQLIPQTPKVVSPNVPMNGASPRGIFMKKFPQTPQIDKQQLTFDINNFGKPRISKTANDIFAAAKKQIIVTPKLQDSPNSRPKLNSPIIQSFADDPFDEPNHDANEVYEPINSPNFEPIFAQPTAPHNNEVNLSSSEQDSEGIELSQLISSTSSKSITKITIEETPPPDLVPIKTDSRKLDMNLTKEFPIKPDFGDEPQKQDFPFAIVEPKADVLLSDITDDLSSDMGTYNRMKIKRRPRPPMLNIQPAISSITEAETPQPKKIDVQEPSLHVKGNKIHANTPRIHNQKIMSRPPKPPIPSNRSPRKPRVKELSVDDIISDLRSSEWEKQNDAASYLTKLVITNTSFVHDNLRVFVFELFPLTVSIRSALAKTALICLKELAEKFGQDFSPFFEATLNELLVVILSSKIFINKLASECIDLILEGINRRQAIDFLLQDHRKRPVQCRVALSANLAKLCSDIDDPNRVITSLGWFVTDASPDVRKNARSAIAKMKEKFSGFKYMVVNSSLDESEKKVVLSNLD